jgi:hypothetical protein
VMAGKAIASDTAQTAKAIEEYTRVEFTVVHATAVPWRACRRRLGWIVHTVTDTPGQPS